MRHEFRSDLVETPTDHVEVRPLHHDLNERLNLAIGHMLGINVEELKEATVLGIFVRVKITELRKELGYCLCRQVPDETLLEDQVHCFSEFGALLDLSRVLLVLRRVKLVNS